MYYIYISIYIIIIYYIICSMLMFMLMLCNICLFYLHVKKKRNVKTTFSIDFQERRHASSVAAPTNAGLNDSSSATRPLLRPCSNFVVTSSNAFWSRCAKFAMARQQATNNARCVLRVIQGLNQKMCVIQTCFYYSCTMHENYSCRTPTLLLFMHYA